MTHYQGYHPNFQKRRKQVLAEFGKACLRCGIEDRAIVYSKGRITMMFLHIAHVDETQNLAADAELIPLCPRCHWFFDHPRGDNAEGLSDWAFIGKVMAYFIEKESH